jgi:fructokinase
MRTPPTPYRIGIDLGGTKIEIAVLDSELQVIKRQRIATEAHLGPDHIVGQIKKLYDSVKDQFPVHTLGVGTPGSLSKLTKTLRNSNTVCLNGLPLQKLIEDRLGLHIQIENDANCFALAEATLGAGQSNEMVFGVIIGTGCGGGWVINQRLRTGPQSIAGEWGHMMLEPSGLPCFCGHCGCVETFISGSGVERQYAALKPGESKSCERIFEDAKSSELSLSSSKSPESVVVNLFYEKLGQSLANLINAVDPDIIVLGGGLSNIEGLADRAQREVRKRVFTKEFTTPIVRHELGDSAGVIGAALIGAAKD